MNEVNESEEPKQARGYQWQTLRFPDWQMDGVRCWKKIGLGQSVLGTVLAAQPSWI